ncbi:unnamed protein product [Leptosia nina]|uniref:Uncharacterized protein n=1 Tax=Leptosia nina TaxID=320188 RepID=A0AAV1K6H4_9NEOP
MQRSLPCNGNASRARPQAVRPARRFNLSRLQSRQTQTYNEMERGGSATAARTSQERRGLAWSCKAKVTRGEAPGYASPPRSCAALPVPAIFFFYIFLILKGNGSAAAARRHRAYAYLLKFSQK